MKKITVALLLLSILLTLGSCVERKSPVVTPDTEGGSTTEAPSTGETPAAGPFTVTVMLAGKPYAPKATANDEKAFKVRFSNAKEVKTVNVGADGTATVDGLDGDYAVTLLNLPDGYTYNPNIYTVSNDSPKAIVEIMKYNTTRGTSGLNMYEPIGISKTGVYRATIKKEGQVIYYQFSPSKAGVYRFESMMDISAEMFNPKAEVYTGSFAAWYYNSTLDTGGASGSYTKNFLHELKIDEEYVNNSWLIGIRVEGKDATYPTYVDFSVSYHGAYHEEFVSSSLIGPTFIPGSRLPTGERSDNAFLEWREELHAYLDADKAAFGSSTYHDAAVRIDNKRIFDEDYYKVNPEDGLYHVYDLEKYAATNGFGPILYADITIDNMFMESTDYPSAFNVVEYNGNKALTLCEGTVNYKLFIEGYDVLSYQQSGQNGSYFCNSNCPCYLDYKDGKPGNNGGVCTIEENCQQCKDECRHIPEVLKYQHGYADIVNGDGRAPVSEELMLFLQRYSENQRLFSDGNGWVETYEPRYDAYEDSQWLFACGYYSD